MNNIQYNNYFRKQTKPSLKYMKNDMTFIHRLENAKGLESDHDDPNLSQEIHANLTKLTQNQTPPELKEDMKG